MQSLERWTAFWRLVLLFVCGAAMAAAAPLKLEDWTDLQGAKFRGAPSALVGPLALFRTGQTTARRVPVNLLSPEDCLRFHAALATQPARAADWAQAKSGISTDLIGHVLRLKDGKLVPADLAGKPEPEYYVLFFVNHGVGPSWEMMGASMAKYGEITRRYPGLVEAVMIGHGQSRGDHIKMATGMNVPWLVTEVMDQAGMTDVRRYLPPSAPYLAIVTRDGTALFGSAADKKEKVESTWAGFADLLALAQTTDPRGWGPLTQYWRAVAVAEHRVGRGAPRLVGDPLIADVLRSKGVERFDATLKVSEEGKVVDVEIQPDAKIPADLVNPIRLALVQAAVVPAVADGKFVAGELAYHFGPVN